MWLFPASLFLLLSSCYAIRRSFSSNLGLADLGVPNYSCSPDLMKPSKTKPTNVNSVRPADINVVMAMGDSLTAANGAGAEDPLGVVLQYRGLAFQAGGDNTLDTHTTIPNILKKYNPKLFGYSNGIGSPIVWEIAKLNIAMPGAKAKDMPGQARQLVALLNQHPEDFTPTTSANHIAEAIQIIHDNVPRVIVSITGMLHLEVLRNTETGHMFCTEMHIQECGCEANRTITNQQIGDYCVQYADDEMAIQTSMQFEKEDFAVVVQPFFRDITTPPTSPDGSVNLGFFAPDCFHFSQYGHALVTTWLWKNILEPVGSKTTQGSMTTPALPLACPDPACPFIRTTKNSQNCTSYQTPVAP